MQRCKRGMKLNLQIDSKIKHGSGRLEYSTAITLK